MYNNPINLINCGIKQMDRMKQVDEGLGITIEFSGVFKVASTHKVDLI